MNKGLSGSYIEMIDNFTIRKKSTNPRLVFQCEKQMKFSSSYSSLINIKTPNVISYKWNDKDRDFYFDMEYIPSSSFKDFFLSANKVDLDRFYHDLKQYLDLSHRVNSFSLYDCNSLIKKKLNTLLSGKYKDFVNYIIHLLKNETIVLPNTNCHGDLTTSNILFNNGKHYFIDFLDSHIDTYYYDLSKLKQDLYYKWSLNVEKVTSLKVEQCIDYLWRMLYNDYITIFESREFQFIDALTLLRIDPYVKDEDLDIILNNSIRKLKLYEQFVIADSRKV